MNTKRQRERKSPLQGCAENQKGMLQNPIRLKRRKVAVNDLEKENALPSDPSKSYLTKSVPPAGFRQTRNTGGRSTTRKAIPLQPKTLNTSIRISTPLDQHPISRHILKSNLYDDESWIDQQQQLFTTILNRTFAQYGKASSWGDEEAEGIKAVAFQYYQSELLQSTVPRLRSVHTSLFISY
jgi:hypothetical protein